VAVDTFVDIAMQAVVVVVQRAWSYRALVGVAVQNQHGCWVDEGSSRVVVMVVEASYV